MKHKHPNQINARNSQFQQNNASAVKGSAQRKFYEIKTAVGTEYLPSEKMVRTELPDKSMLVRPVCNVSRGDMIAIRVDSIEGVSLKDVGETLILESPRYLHSINALFVDNGGKPSPLFQFALIGSESGNDSLAIYNRLVSGRVSNPVSLDHIDYNWLGGRVVCPNNAAEIAPVLGVDAILSSDFKDAYRLYRIIRQVVVRKLHNALRAKSASTNRPGGENATNSASDHNADSVMEEVNIAIRRFISRASTNLFTTPVLGIREIESIPAIAGNNAPHTRRRGKALSLFKGIVTENMHDSEVKLKPLPELLADYNAIDGVASNLAYQILIKGGENISMKSEPGKMSFFSTMVFCKELEHFLGFPLDNPKIREKIIWDQGFRNFSVYRIESDTVAVEKAKLYGTQILNGSLDAKFGFPRGALLSIFECHAKVCASIPPEIFAANEIHQYIQRVMEADKKRNYTSFTKELKAIKSILSDPAHKKGFQQFSVFITDEKKLFDAIERYVPELAGKTAKIRELIRPLLEHAKTMK